MASKKQPDAKRKPPPSVKIIDVIRERFDVYRDGVRKEVFAVPKTSPRIALDLYGNSQTVQSAATNAYMARYGSPPPDAAMKQALRAIEAAADEADEVDTYLRSARVGNALYVDMGDATGRQIVIKDGKWFIRESDGSILFRRTPAIGPMPNPVVGGSLDRLRSEFRIPDDQWDLIRAWLVIAWMTDIPVPVLALLGPNGAGKSFLAKLLVNLVDPGILLGTRPRDIRDWVQTANNQRVIGIDNLSSIPDWLEDPFCACVTGDHRLERALFTNDDVKLYVYKRAMIITSIDPGALRSDVADRLMPADLESLVGWRRGENELNMLMTRMTPELLGGLLDLIARTMFLGQQPVPEPPRMVDAVEYMAAVDAITGGNAVKAFRAARINTAQTVIESDPLGDALIKIIRDCREWSGTPTALHELLTEAIKGGNGAGPPEGWPGNARVMSSKLRNMQQPLEDNELVSLVWARSGNDRVINIAALGKLGERGSGAEDG